VAAGAYDALARDLAACKIARDGWIKASDEAHARIAQLEADNKMLRETIDAIDNMPTGMSPAVCRAMAAYWNGLADRMAAFAPKEPT
jgi:hypothetical protein